jgi:hypothetical protein
MRIDRLWARTLPLATLLFIAPAAALAAQPSAALPAVPLATLLQTAEDGGRVITGDHTIAAGESVEDIVVIGGTLTVRGEVTGDAVVVGGNLLMESGGSVGGDAVVTGGDIVDHGGKIRGEMRVVDGADEALSSRAAHGAGQGMAAVAGAREQAQQSRSAARVVGDRADHRGHAWFGPIRNGFNGLVSTIALGIVLACIGAALVCYGRPYLETVSDTIRTSTVRAGAVGIAASFLVVPAFVVLVVAFAVSIVGIPLLVLAVPLYPLAVAGAVGMGLLSAAHALGERTADQRYEAFDLRYRNSYSYLFTGLGMLLTPLLAAHLLHMTGFLGFLGTILQVVTWMAIWLAATVGLGGVILSRAGTRRSFVGPMMEPTYDTDPLFDEPVSRGTNV